MGRPDDPRLARLENIAALLSEMDECMRVLAARQRGNLRREDRAEVERHHEAWRAAVALLREERRERP